VSPPEPELIAGEYWYTIYFGPGKKGRHPEGDLEPFELATGVADILRAERFASREAFTKLLCHLRLSTSLRSQIYAMAASRTTFYAYQFKPLLKFLESRHHRLLIADEVGLGKTIETGLIFTELRQRRPLKRVLIVPPSHLMIKWREEMRNRFDLQFDILDTNGAFDFLRRFEEEGDETTLRGILSLQTLRGRRLQERWEAVEPALDLVVFDEAGRLRNPETRSHGAASLVGENADGVLLLTATPVQTGDDNLFHLLRLLEPDEFSSFDVFCDRLAANRHVLDTLRLLAQPDVDLTTCAAVLRRVEATPIAQRFVQNPLYNDVLHRLQELTSPTLHDRLELQRDLNGVSVLSHVLSRTRKREVHEKQPMRRARVVRAEPTADEQAFYDLVTEVCRQAYARFRDNVMAAFATMMPQRQVASCMVAMIDYCLERLAGRGNRGDEGEESDLTIEDFEVDADDRPTSGVNWAALGDLHDWRRRLAARDTKWDKLREVLRTLDTEELGAKVIVYSFFKKTLGYIEERLAAEGIRTIMITGDVPAEQDVEPGSGIQSREARIEEFAANPKIRVLLSTEVGDEGLDLQFAHTLVNYDLPWNPMRVEQRIGRLDRIGQKSDFITIVNLSMPGTIEDRILERLYKRIKIFEHSIGDLGAILGEEIRRLEADFFSSKLSPAEQEDRITQTADVFEKRKLDLERFQEEATALIGQDEFFLEEIDQARQRQRYVGGPELLVYLQEYLRAHQPQCKLQADGAPDLYRLVVTEDLRLFAREAIPSDDLGLRLFLARSNRGEIVFTTSSEVARDNRKLEFLTFHHPLIRAISKYYDQHRTELHPVSHVRLATQEVPPATYVWFLYLVEITGVRPVRDLECVAVECTSGIVLDVDRSEGLLTEMIARSDAVPAPQRGLPIPEAVIQKADEVLVHRLEARFRDRRRANEALVVNQLASLEESFKRNQRLRQERIAMAKMRGRKESYIRGLETGLRNFEVAHAARLREVEAGRKIGKSFSLRGAGLVEVSANE
jgi:superfamily II DNA or RNA helicase